MLGIGVRKAIRKIRQLLYRFSYKILFIIRRDRIKKFEKIADSKDIYFTIELHKAGFTDQLIQFSVFYDLGKALNCKYFYTPLVSKRSRDVSFDDQKESSKENEVDNNQSFKDIYDFLGCDDYLRELSVEKPGTDTEPINMDLDDSFFNLRGLVHNNLFSTYLKFKLYPLIKGENKVAIRFRLKGFSSFFGTYNLLEGCPNSTLHFRSAFFEKQKKYDWRPSQNIESKYKTIVHIRQGDTAIIKTPWNTYVNAWRGFNIDNSMLEFDTLDQARIYSHIGVEDYQTFLNTISDQLKDDFFPVQIFSDGYKRAFRNIMRGSVKFGWSQDKIKEMKTSAESYNQKMFSSFSNDKKYVLSIGEEKEKLYDFVFGLIHADIVVIGTQQRMVPKFLSVYCTPENMPLVIVLYRDFEPRVYGLGRAELFKNYLLVDINNYNISAVVRQIQEFVLNREKKSSNR